MRRYTNRPYFTYFTTALQTIVIHSLQRSKLMVDFLALHKLTDKSKFRWALLCWRTRRRRLPFGNSWNAFLYSCCAVQRLCWL